MKSVITWDNSRGLEEPDAPLMADLHREPEADPLELTLQELEEIYSEIEEQPTWRATADKEMDYADGKQLDSDLLKKQASLGIPPAIEDLIGPALRALAGYEVSVRTDWRVTPDGGPDGQDVADAINYRLNQAERQSRADRACSEAFRSQAACGIGWVEVTRETNPFKYPFKCQAIHRNEIHWDMLDGDLSLENARWLKRSRWIHPVRLKLLFPEHAELIEGVGRDGSMWWGSSLIIDGGQSTGLRSAWGESHQSIQEALWYNSTSKELCLSEIWYRRWMPATILKLKDGRAVEYDKNNLAHAVAIETGAKIVKATVDRIRRAYWIGPHKLVDEPSPYPHTNLGGYVPFFGFREDNSGVPYGYVRGMKYPQDSLNSGVSKLRWGMAVARVERTKGAVDMPDALFRREVARSDADIILNAEHMARPGARFEVKRDYQLTDQHYQMLMDNRASIERTSAITTAMQGRAGGTAKSGQQEAMQIEQSNQSLSDLMDNFRAARSQVGELLMALIIEDMGNEEQVVVIEGDAITADRTVVLNKPETDEFGEPYLSNDAQRTRLKVALEDVPSTSSFRAQQLAAMSEAVKALPANYQAAAMPFLASLMDVPFKRDLVEALRAAGAADAPKEIEKRVRAEIGNELKAQELELKAKRMESEIREIDARSVQIGVQAAYSAMQAGAQIAQMPQIAPVADAVMQSSGYRPPNPPGVDPNYPTPAQAPLPAVNPEAAPPVRQNTSPAFPPVPDSGPSPMTGIETPTTTDNLNP